MQELTTEENTKESPCIPMYQICFKNTCKYVSLLNIFCLTVCHFRKKVLNFLCNKHCLETYFLL